MVGIFNHNAVKKAIRNGTIGLDYTSLNIALQNENVIGIDQLGANGYYVEYSLWVGKYEMDESGERVLAGKEKHQGRVHFQSKLDINRVNGLLFAFIDCYGKDGDCEENGKAPSAMMGDLVGLTTRLITTDMAKSEAIGLAHSIAEAVAEISHPGSEYFFTELRGNEMTVYAGTEQKTVKVEAPIRDGVVSAINKMMTPVFIAGKRS